MFKRLSLDLSNKKLDKTSAESAKIHKTYKNLGELYMDSKIYTKKVDIIKKEITSETYILETLIDEKNVECNSPAHLIRKKYYISSDICKKCKLNICSFCEEAHELKHLDSSPISRIKRALTI